VALGWRLRCILKTKSITVYPTVRNAQDVQTLKSLGFLHAMKLDVTKPEEISAVIAAVLEKEGKIDVWFNNAGYGQPGALEDVSTEKLREQFETNVFGLHECTRQIIPVMRKQGYGKIIQHSSVLGLISLPARGAYNASKYAVEGLSDTLRLELKGTQIFSVLLNTGPIESDFRKNAVRKLQENIDIERSVFKEGYEKKHGGYTKKSTFQRRSCSRSDGSSWDYQSRYTKTTVLHHQSDLSFGIFKENVKYKYVR